MNAPPVLSVIVPTHNRSGLLAQSLDALSRQSYPASQFEVIVAADACQDDTTDRVRALAAQVPYRLSLVSHEAHSAAATRNLGVTRARGSILLFLDDDVVASQRLVQAHAESQHTAGIVLGYSKPILPEEPSWWQYDAYRWWEDAFRAMQQPGHRFNYRDFFSGNVSMSATLFHRVGGFDTSITGRLEDYELGMRLLKAGATFRFMPQALGHHHDHTDLADWLRRIRQEGIADIQTGQSHPELRTRMLGFIESRGRRARWLRKLAFSYPQWGDRLADLFCRQAAFYERLRLRGRWRNVVWSLREYNYWRGIAEELGEEKDLANWLQEAPGPPTVGADAPVLDLLALPPRQTLSEKLEAANHKGLRLMIGDIEALTLPPQPGAEPLNQDHLWSALRSLAQQRFVPALAMHLIQSNAFGSDRC